jgi:hypothetical protein
MLTKKTSKNQITIPKKILQQIPESIYFDVSARAGEIVLKPVSVQPTEDRLSLVRDKIASLGLKESVLEDAIRWARRRK